MTAKPANPLPRWRALDAWQMKGIHNVAGASSSGTGKETLT